MRTGILDSVGRKGMNAAALADTVASTPELAAELVKGLDHETARVRFGSAKVLMVLSERHPAVAYPYYATFAKLLDCGNRIMQWTAIRILGNLACIDAAGRTARLMDRYLAIIRGNDMVGAVNAIAGAARIARAKPRLCEKIVKGILKVDKACYRTPECRNVAIGEAITALRAMGSHVASRTDVRAFVKRQVSNPRASTRKKALAFLDQLGSHPHQPYKQTAAPGSQHCEEAATDDRREQSALHLD